MAVLSKHFLTETINAVWEEWKDKPEVTAAEVAAEVRNRLSDAEQLEALAIVLPAYVSSKKSAESTSLHLHATPDEGAQQPSAGIQKAGKPWTHQKSFSSLRFNAGNGTYVSWPNVTKQMVEKSIALLDKKISTSIQNRDWRVAVRDAMQMHDAEMIKDLPADVRTSLEKMKGVDLATA